LYFAEKLAGKLKKRQRLAREKELGPFVLEYFHLLQELGRTRAVSCALVGGLRDIKSEINQGGLGRYWSTGNVDSGFIALLFEA
jgi:hypothetical protein